MASPDKAKWVNAMEKEMDPFIQMKFGIWWSYPKTEKLLAVSGYMKPREVLIEQFKSIRLAW